MLNITGGGIGRFKKEHKLVYTQPDYIFRLDADPEFVKKTVSGLFA